MKLFLCFAMLMVAGCGIQKVAERTLGQVEDSNEKQQKLLDYMAETAELTKQITEHNASIDKYSGQVAHGIHLQILSSAMDGMFAPQNTEVLMPPLGMMPYAEIFAEEAYPEELIKTLDFMLKRVYMTPAEHDKIRQVSLMSLGLIAAFASESVIEAVFNSQVETPGLYEEAAYAMATTRFHFMRDFLLTPIYESSDLQNVATLQAATQIFTKMKRLTESQYVHRFQLNIPSIGVEEWTVGREELVLLGKRAKRKFIQKLGEGTLQLLETQTLLEAFEIE